MEWIESKIFTTPEGIEPVSGMLMSCGVNGVQIHDEQDMKRFLEQNPFRWDYIDDSLLNEERQEAYVQFYLPSDAHGMESLAAVKDGIEYLKGLELGFSIGNLELIHENVDDREWLEHWKQYYKPFKVGNIVIKPVWEPYAPAAGETVFTINPGHVFGTGLHQTTQLCIEELEKLDLQGASVLDLGCGSGILSIISLMLGSSYAMAVDLDPSAVDIAYENADLNRVGRDKYTVLYGNVLNDEPLRVKITQRRYDVVIANIVADVIIGLTGFARECLRENGVFISSGIIRERLEDVTSVLEDNGFEIKEIVNKDDWICITSVPRR